MAGTRPSRCDADPAIMSVHHSRQPGRLRVTRALVLQAASRPPQPSDSADFVAVGSSLACAAPPGSARPSAKMYA